GHRRLPAFSVQYHPEGCPGPQDNQHLYDRFIDMVRTGAPMVKAVAGMQEEPRPRKVLILGSGPIVIGQAAEFDYAGTQACKEMLAGIGEPVPLSRVCESLEEVKDFAAATGLPLVIRPAYTLGGTGGGFVTNDDELERVAMRGLAASPIHQVLIERSLWG